MKETGKEHSVDIEKYKVIRERWDKEDTLLVSRTGVFLTTNSILLAAAGFQAKNPVPAFQIGVAILGLALSVLWLTTSWHSFRIIRTLFLMCKDDMPYGLRKIFDLPPILFRPNAVFCKIMPGLFIVGWLALIIWTII